MKEKIKLFRESLQLVWNSSAGWTLTNIVMSTLRSVFPLMLIWLLKIVIDDITQAAKAVSSAYALNIIWPILAVAIIWFLNKADPSSINMAAKKKAINLRFYSKGFFN